MIRAATPERAANCPSCGTAMADVEVRVTGVCPTHGIQHADSVSSLYGSGVTFTLVGTSRRSDRSDYTNLPVPADAAPGEALVPGVRKFKPTGSRAAIILAAIRKYEAECHARVCAKSQRLFGHPGASIWTESPTDEGRIAAIEEALRG